MSSNPRQLFSEAQKQNFLNEWKRSGKSKLAFCNERGIKYATVVSWTRDRKKKKNTVAKASFIPVSVANSGDSLFAQVNFKNGTVINIYQAVNADFISGLVRK